MQDPSRSRILGPGSSSFWTTRATWAKKHWKRKDRKWQDPLRWPPCRMEVGALKAVYDMEKHWDTDLWHDLSFSSRVLKIFCFSGLLSQTIKEHRRDQRRLCLAMSDMSGCSLCHAMLSRRKVLIIYVMDHWSWIFVGVLVLEQWSFWSEATPQEICAWCPCVFLDLCLPTPFILEVVHLEEKWQNKQEKWDHKMKPGKQEQSWKQQNCKQQLNNTACL